MHRARRVNYFHKKTPTICKLEHKDRAGFSSYQTRFIWVVVSLAILA